MYIAAVQCFETHVNNSHQNFKNNKEKLFALKRIELCKKYAQNLDDLSSKVHFISLKLIKDLSIFQMKFTNVFIVLKV